MPRRPKAPQYVKLSSFVCGEESCGKTFDAYPSDRPLANAYCSHACAAKSRERNKGHGSVTLPCGFCGEPVTRPRSAIAKKSGNLFCNRAHFLAYLHRKREPA